MRRFSVSEERNSVIDAAAQLGMDKRTVFEISKRRGKPGVVSSLA